MAVLAGCTPAPQSSDYDTELQRIQDDIRKTEAASLDPAERAGRIAYLFSRRAAFTGDPDHILAAGTATDHAIQETGGLADLHVLRANLHLKLHRVSEAKKVADQLEGFAADPPFETLKADLAFQEGRYEEARSGYEAVVRTHGTWDGLARLAHYAFITGDVVEADALYVRAQDKLSAKEMEHYSWVELQRGFLKFSRGRHDEALAHYDRAEQVFSGSWLVADYKAEALGAKQRFGEAEALYKKLIERTARPEFQQALGDLYLFKGDPEKAKPWHEKALAGYLESISRGEVHYLHHLVGFYADVRNEGAEAVRWAQQDAEMRRNFLTEDALAWALYRNSQFSEALAAIDRVLSSPIQDAQIFVHAALIHLANGRTEDGKALFARAARINPSYGSFHAHR